ncbi:MAG: DUF488 domain-containing protein [bacterium]|nr:DUF488 domain-containing protein [bacterium]
MEKGVEATEILTIGHSTLPYERFLELLRKGGITAIADVRTSPYSSHFPHFSQGSLKEELRMDGIAYSFLGQELGGRPKGRHYFRDGVADYERMARSPDFARGLQRVLDGSRRYRIALMCSEHAPLDCHRCLLVGRALAAQGTAVKHILADSAIVDHQVIEGRLMKSEGEEGADLFLSPEERLAKAYRKRARKVAYSEESKNTESRAATG